MTPERWQQIDRIFHAALERAPDERAAFVAARCVDDETLRREIHDLLVAHEQSNSFIEAPAADVAASLMTEDAAGFNAGQAVGPYTIVNLLGAGGMGQVYLATDTRLGRNVALKILPHQFTIDPDRVRRFEKEARAASALNHPNIVTIHEVGSFDDTRFIVTEFVEGHTLRQLIDEKPLTIHESINVAIQVASALKAAHAAGIVHRDIKPENVMLRSDGYVKVLDFGLAKLTESSPTAAQLEDTTLLRSNPGLVMGTVQYMSPEQARGKTVDARTDIWSLGVVLYELLAGKVPFSGETPSHVMVALMEQEPLPLVNTAGVPSALNEIVSKALRKKTNERYQTADDLVRDLKKFKQTQIESRFRESAADEFQSPATPNAAGDKATGRLDATVTARTMAVGTARPTSSAEYVVGEIKRHKLVSIIVAVIVLSVAIASFAYLAHTATGGEAIDSVAVLPFINVTNDANAEYLSDGLSDSIIDDLSQLPNLKRVSAFNSVLRYKGKQVDPQTAGTELHVRAVLIGRMTQHGDDLLITTELIDVKDNKRLWGGQYNRKVADMLKLQGEIAQEITDRLRLRLTRDEKQRLTKSGTDNPEAYQLYLKGRFFKRNRLGAGKAKDSLEQAIKIDPNFAPAYAQLAYAYNASVYSAAPKEAEEAERNTETAARKALLLDDTLGDGHAALGLTKCNTQDWNACLAEFQRALDLDPNSADVWNNYARVLWSLGRSDEAIFHMKRSQELDPLSLVNYLDMARIYNSIGQYDQAIEQSRKALELNANHPLVHNQLRTAYLHQGKYDEALAEAEKVTANGNGGPANAVQRIMVLGETYAITGRRAEALKLLDELKELTKQQYVNPENFARFYAWLGDKDRAIEYLQKQYAENPRGLSGLKTSNEWDILRADPRFKELLRQMKLSE